MKTTLPPSKIESVNTAHAVTEAARHMLGQCGAFVGALPDTVYTAEAETIRGGTVGKHIRHALDHFHAALAGLNSPEPIDYDHRERDQPMEADRAAACGAISALSARLAELDPAVLDRPVRVRVMLAADGTMAELVSTLARELAFATHHAVHHQAMMKTIAAEFGIQANADFGKAPSTLNHQRTCAVPGSPVGSGIVDPTGNPGSPGRGVSPVSPEPRLPPRR